MLHTGGVVLAHLEARKGRRATDEAEYLGGCRHEELVVEVVVGQLHLTERGDVPGEGGVGTRNSVSVEVVCWGADKGRNPKIPL